MGRSVRDYITELGIELRDTAGSQNIWSFAEQYRSLQHAFRRAKGYLQVPEVYDSLVFSIGRFDYPLPQYVSDIRRIDYGVSAVGSSAPAQWMTLTSWRQVQTAETNLLRIEGVAPVPQSYSARVYYQRDLTVPPVEATLALQYAAATQVDATQAFLPVIASGGDFPRAWDPLLPLYVQVDDEVMEVNAVTATSFTAVSRGMFGTQARANSLQWGIGAVHNSAKAITPYIPTDVADQFILAAAKQELYLTRLNDSPAEENRSMATLAGEYGRAAAEALSRYQPNKVARVMKQRLLPRR